MARSDDTPPNPLNIALNSQRESAQAVTDAVEKTSVGRGNVISLPGRTPEGARSPFDGE